jgi:hypothetical protein
MVDAGSAAGGGTGAPGSAVGAQAYLDALAPIMARVSRQADGPVQQAAELVVASLRAGGVVQAFGTGHSEALAMEFAGRAGGLVPTNRISLRDVVIFGGESPEVLGDGLLERDPSIAHRLYDLSPRWRPPTCSSSARTRASTAPSSSSRGWSRSAGTG